MPAIGLTAPASGQNYVRLVLVPLCVVAIEIQCVFSLQPLLSVLRPGDASTLAFQVAGSSAVGVTVIHNLIKGAIVVGLIWMVLFGTELYRARSRFVSTTQVAPVPKATVLAHILALISLIVVRASLNGYGSGWVDIDSSLASAIYATAFTAFALSTFRLWAPFGFWRRYVGDHRLRFLVLAALSIGLAFAWTLGIRPVDLEPIYLDLFFAPTAMGASKLLVWWGYEVSVNASNLEVSVNDFAVQLWALCLGYEGMGIALIVLSTYFYLNRETIRFPQALLVVPAAFAALFATNCVRVAALLAIGASWSPDIALKGFHSVAGSINLLAILMLAVLALNHFRFFSKNPGGFTFDLSTDKVQLLPQVVLLAVALLSLLGSAGFDWLYPLRVAIVGVLLVTLWPRLRLDKISNIGLPALVGLVVFAVWLALVPHEPEKSALFAKTLFSAPEWLALTWMVMRTLGAVLIVPLAEELAFRGSLFNLLERTLVERGIADSRMRQFLALLITSIGFGLLHSAWLAGALAGLAYGLLKLYRGRVIDAVVAHAVTNFLLAMYAIKFHAWSFW